jgi:hypothetical protein
MPNAAKRKWLRRVIAIAQGRRVNNFRRQEKLLAAAESLKPVRR